jgi:mannose-6-phosphate isomerase-like protein (cupin superfamily)
MKDGWFVGDFLPTAFRTTEFEVCYKKHKKNEKWDTHYHEKITEINLLVKGKMTINDTLISEGEIFVIPPFYVSEPRFLEDCELVIVKTPSITSDKIIIKK